MSSIDSQFLALNRYKLRVFETPFEIYVELPRLVNITELRPFGKNLLGKYLILEFHRVGSRCLVAGASTDRGNGHRDCGEWSQQCIAFHGYGHLLGGTGKPVPGDVNLLVESWHRDPLVLQVLHVAHRDVSPLRRVNNRISDEGVDILDLVFVAVVHCQLW